MSTQTVRRRILTCLTVLVFGTVGPAAAVDPACVAPDEAPLTAEETAYQQYCTNHSTAVCDLGMTYWDPSTHVSPDIRIGDPYITGTENPRFFYDSAGDFYYTRLYLLFTNLGSGPALFDEVSVDFAVTTDVAAALVNPENVSVTWQQIGNYNVHVPSSPRVVFPGVGQQVAVCWKQPSGVLFPNRFILRATVNWAEDSLATSTIATSGDTIYKNTTYSLYDLRELGQPAKIALALDLSGSMDDELSTGQTKLTVAKFRANQFVDLVEEGHQLGVYGFTTDNPANTSFTTTYRDAANTAQTRTLHETSVIEAIGTITDTTDKNAIKLAISGQTDHGCTPVGQGLLRARQEILDSPFPEAGGSEPSKAIVLFSDGLQNVPPFVNVTSWTCDTGTAGPVISAANAFADDPATTNVDEQMAVHSIFFGEEADMASNVMNDIQNQTGGTYVYGVTDDLGLAIAYYAIRGLVDDMIYLEEAGSVALGTPSDPFTVHFDSAAGEATVSVAWSFDDGLARLTIDRAPAGTADWIAFEPETLAEIPSPTNDLSPYRVFRFTPGPNSSWQFRVRQVPTRQARIQASATFAAAVFSDVEELRLRPALGDEGFTAGDPLPIYAELSSVGHPVLGSEVRAMVQVPNRAFSSTLRRYAGRFSGTASPDAGKAAGIVRELKQFLLADEGSDELYRFEGMPVTLRDDGNAPDQLADDGVYSGALPGSETRVAGRYEVTIVVRGELPSGKSGERWTKLETIAGVGPADPKQSVVEIGRPDPMDDGTSVVHLRILPTDRYGNAAFPGSGNLIRVKLDGEPVPGLVDNFDTTFNQQIVIPTNRGAALAVEVGQVTLVDRPIGRREEGLEHRHEWSLHLGTAIPHGRFAQLFDGGPAVGIDYTRRFDRHFALRAELDFDRFDVTAGGDRWLTHANLYLQYRHAGAGRWIPYFEGGVGGYDLQGSSAFGFALGVGAFYELSSQWDLDFTVRGHRAGGGLDLGFSQVLGGVIYKF